jgi:hypothetical protein
MTVTAHQASTIQEIQSAVSFFLQYDCRSDITFTQVLDKAGVEYPVFYSVVNMLKKNREWDTLRGLAAKLQEINVLKNVKILGDLPGLNEEVEDEPKGEIVSVPVRTSTVEPDDSADVIAWQTIVQALKPISQRRREAVLHSVNGFYGIGVG